MCGCRWPNQQQNYVLLLLTLVAILDITALSKVVIEMVLCN